MPGLGVSVATSRHYGPALRQWDEAAAGEAAEAAAEESGGNNSGGLGARLVRLLNLRRRNTTHPGCQYAICATCKCPHKLAPLLWL